MSGIRSMGSFENEKTPKRAIAKKQSDVIIGFFTALSYILILQKFYCCLFVLLFYNLNLCTVGKVGLPCNYHLAAILDARYELVTVAEALA